MDIEQQSADKHQVDSPLHQNGFYRFRNGKLEGPVSLKDAFTNSTPDTINTRQELDNPLTFQQKINELSNSTSDAVQEFRSTVLESINKIEELSKTQDIAAALQGLEESPGTKAYAGLKSLVKNKNGVADMSLLTSNILSHGSLLKPSFITLKGRLRLGQHRYGAIRTVLGYIFSLGLNWGSQLAAIERDIYWHMHGQINRKPWYKTLLSYIPIVHFFIVYQLAKKLVAMERQNGYQSTSPLFAATVAVIPPLAVAYLNSRLNRHWDLHVFNLSQ